MGQSHLPSERSRDMLPKAARVEPFVNHSESPLKRFTLSLAINQSAGVVCRVLRFVIAAGVIVVCGSLNRPSEAQAPQRLEQDPGQPYGDGEHRVYITADYREKRTSNGGAWSDWEPRVWERTNPYISGGLPTFDVTSLAIGAPLDALPMSIYSPFVNATNPFPEQAHGLQRIDRIGYIVNGLDMGGPGIWDEVRNVDASVSTGWKFVSEVPISRMFITVVGAPTPSGEAVIHDSGFLSGPVTLRGSVFNQFSSNSLNLDAMGRGSISIRYNVYAVNPLDEPSSYAASINTPAGATQTQAVAGYPRITTATSVTKTGPGTLVMDNANPYTGTTTVSEGTLTITNPLAVQSSPLIVRGGGIIQLPKNTPIVVPTKTIEVDVASGGRIDVGVGLINCFPPNGAGDGWLVDWISAGRDGGSWQGSGGITSSAVVDDAAEGKPRAVGWKEHEDGSVTVGYAAPGDTNLDGEVNVFDLVNVNGSGTYGKGNASNWSQGDFDYNGVTNIFDIVMVNGAGVYGRGRYVPGPASGGVAAVPEPSTCVMALAGLACGGYTMFRRRKQA
jgi:autotransporter-associated beta strand protein